MMADAGNNAECTLCMRTFTDPRMLPCIHTFCFECLKRAAERSKKKAGDTIPCPLCQKKFTIPREGIVGLQKKVFVEAKKDKRRMPNVKSCTIHTKKPLDYYCVDCKKIVCVSCFDEDHKSHDCKGVTAVDEELRQAIKKKAWKISNYRDEMLSIRQIHENRKAEFLKEIAEKEMEIHKRYQELRDMLAENTKSLIEQFSAKRSIHLKEMEIDIEEIDKCCTIFRSFEARCTELTSEGSASDICSSVDQLIGRADELEKDHRVFLDGPRRSVEVSFQAADLKDVLQRFNNNILGQIEVERKTSEQFQSHAIVVGLDYGSSITRDVVQINLHRSNEISSKEQIPTRMAFEAFAAVYCNTVYITGIGDKTDEIWKFNFVSGWKKCASLVQGRRRHSAAFIDEVLYICGGFVDSKKTILDSVETYNAITDKCCTVGKLVHCVHSSGNCVPFKSSLFIFGGLDKDDNDVSQIHIYKTEENTCTLLSKPMPRPFSRMQAVLWEKSVILFGPNTCLIFDFLTEKWQEREKFKTGVVHFGLVLENEEVFVIGGGTAETDKDGKQTWKGRDDVRSVPLQNIIKKKPIEWKNHRKLTKPCLVHACAKIRLPV